jgi:outer membrane protein assembly factor BamB
MTHRHMGGRSALPGSAGHRPGSVSPKVSRARPTAGVLAVIALGALLAACGTSKPAAAPGAAPSAPGAVSRGSWPYPNGDLANTRVALGSTISSANVSQLRQAWTFTLPGKGTPGVGELDNGPVDAGPIVQDGVVYMQDLAANVYALSLSTGKLQWEYQAGAPESSRTDPHGVAVVGGKVYGDSSTTVFALNATTGKPAWVDKGVLSTGQGLFDIQPQVAGGRVYLASQYGIGQGGGVLLALNAFTGRLIWKFNTVLRPDPGVQAGSVGSGGAWETPLVSGDGSVTFGTGNPYQSAASAIDHPSAQLYTDSDVNLDAATGKLRWYYQGVPNDFKDYDMQSSPISVRVNGRPMVIGGGKMGYVYAMNANTGQLSWKTPVGQHNGHDNDSLQALEHHSTLKAPYTILPGSVGGVLSNMAVADHSVYVATIDLAFTAKSLDQVLGSPSGSATGEVEALNLATGKVEWDTEVPQPPIGAITVSNDLVFTTLSSGVLIAIDRNTGKIVYRNQVPASTKAPIAIAGNTVLIPVGTPGGQQQLVAYTAP